MGTYAGTTLTLIDRPGASFVHGCDTELVYEFDGQNLSGNDFWGRPLVLKP